MGDSLSPKIEELVPQSMSAIEELPKELFWKILYYIPQASLKIRQTCRMLKSYSDEYVMLQTTIPTIEEVKIDRILPIHSSTNQPEIQISLIISNESSKSLLFKQRLMLAYSLPIAHNLFQKGTIPRLNAQELDWNMTLDSIDESQLAVLGECIGKRIEKTCLSNLDPDAETVISQVLEGKNFTTLTIVLGKLSKEACILLKIIIAQEIEVFKIAIEEIEDDPIGLLTHISSFARCIHLCQSMPMDFRTISSRGPNCRFFYGIYDADWAAIILDLFSRKLDKLVILNPYAFLSDENAKILMKKLPLVGKNLWFTSNCNVDTEEVDYTRNDHIVQVRKSDRKEFWEGAVVLSVKHISRKDEDLWSSPKSTDYPE